MKRRSIVLVLAVLVLVLLTVDGGGGGSITTAQVSESAPSVPSVPCHYHDECEPGLCVYIEGVSPPGAGVCVDASFWPAR